MSSGDPVPPQLLQLSDNKLFFPRWLWLVIHCRFLALVLHFLVECVWTPQLTHFFLLHHSCHWPVTISLGFLPACREWSCAGSRGRLQDFPGAPISLLYFKLLQTLQLAGIFSSFLFHFSSFSFLFFPSFFPPLFFSSFPSFLLIKLIFYTDNSLLIFTILLYIIIKSY